ncbi:Polysaccharide lyase family 1 protein [Rhizoctonia solani]|uniref:Polysaccharide lyase family 1 protein n=1 Tax=Rhizoctonia solani TaxID=456999 RepID=A0A8H7IMT2_9AGAM|nr:Polysaccharide lyase family 1 protein [Rhizoctonia solani]
MKLAVLALYFSALVGSASAQDFKLYGYATLGGGTTGGAGGTVTNVTTRDALIAAVKGNSPKTVYVSGNLGSSSTRITVGNNTSIIGIGSSAIVEGGGFNINKASNIIIRNLVIRKVKGNDGITIQKSNRIWVDHNEFYSDTAHGFDYYDGQVDITHADDYITVSWNKFHDHYKSSLIGGDPGGAAEDTGHYKITYHHNSWNNVHTRTPAIRFGAVHVYNNLLENVVSQGIHTRSYGQVLAQANVFINVTEPISSYGFVIPDDSPDDPKGDYEPDGYANESNNLYISSGPNNITRTGTFTTVPYSFPTDAPSSLKAIVDKYSGTTGGAGGAVVNVTTRDELLAAVKGHLPKIVYVLGNVGGNTTTRMSVGNNTSIIGVGKSAIIEGGGFSVNKASNVIIRNLIIRKVVNNDGITVIQSNNVWIDHNEFYSDTEHGFDYYDGQVDITRGSDYVTVSWNKFHDHYKSSLIGSSEKNGDEDTVISRLRTIIILGTMSTRGLQVLVQANVFRNVKEPISTYGFVIPDDSPIDPSGDYEPDGFANAWNNLYINSGKNNITQIGNFTKVPYSFKPDAPFLVKAIVDRYSGVGKI